MGTDAWGIDDGWHDVAGGWHDLAPGTREALRAAMAPPGADVGEAPPDGPGLRIHRPRDHAPLDRPAVLRLDDGTDLGEVDHLPPDLPLGLHELFPPDGGSATTLLVGTGRCHLPEGLRTWGLAVQVPTTRSTTSWGIGDLADVRALAHLVAGRGGGVLGLSPLHAATPVAPLPASPYSPSSRRWCNPLLLRVDELPDAAGDPTVAEHGGAARALLAAPLVDRDRSWHHQRTALEHLWSGRTDAERDRLSRWRAEQGSALEGWATYCALAEVHGPTWPEWPAPLRRLGAAATAEATGRLTDRVAFHAWLQLLLHDQLQAAAAAGVRLVQDLAIGVAPDGADAWLLQDLLALEMSVGAPPDAFEPQGQRWGLPPFIPWRLRQAGYRPLAELLRASMATGGLRVDHVMGLTRLFWVPDGEAATDGAYVRFHERDLLEVLAMESARAEALVVGEDLGTVEDWLRGALSDLGVLSTRVAWFEDAPPEHYPSQSQAVATTHDLPTTTGVWTGADAAELEALGRAAPPDAAAQVRHRLEALVALPDAAEPAEVVVRVHERLGRSSSVLAMGTLEDLCRVPRRPNVPGTTTERPNWSMALPLSIEDLGRDPAANAAIDALAAPRRPHGTG